MERWLIKGGTVLTMVDGDKPRVADVLVEADRIVAVESTIDADAEVIDAVGCIVAPGFVDTHRHTWQTAARGLVSNDVLKDYFRSVRFQGSLAYSVEDMALGTEAGMLEALDAGVTTVLDFNNNVSTNDAADACVEAIRGTGIRSQFAVGMNNTFGQDERLASLEGRIEMVRRLRDELHDDSALVTLRMALSDLPEAGLERTAAELREARELGIGSTTNSLAILFHEPVDDISVYDEAGLIGPDLLWVHNIYATSEQLARITDLGTHTAVCPESELALGMGRPATTRILAAGGHCSFGCDTVSSNSGNLVQQARVAMQIARYLDNAESMDAGRAPSSFTLKVESLVRALTVWGAEALGLSSQVGTLERGKQADVIVVRADRPSTSPLNDAHSTLLTQTQPADVDTVLVAGRLRKRDGVLVADWQSVHRRLEISRDRIAERIAALGGWHPEPAIPLPW